MRKKLLHYSLTISFSLLFSSFLFSQNIDISYLNPDFVEVCDQGKFEVILVNKSADELTNIRVELLMPDGVSYIQGTVNGATEFDISNLNKPVFRVNDFREDLNFDLEAETDCSLVADINNGKIFTNTITADYDQGRDRVLTLPYRIETGFLVITDISPESPSGIFRDVVERRITVRNTRVGKINGFTFQDSHEGGILIASNGVDPITTAQDYIATFDGSHFQAIGNGDEFFDFNEEIVIIEEITFDNCIPDFLETLSNLTVSWGCKGAFCQSNTNTGLVKFDPYPFEAVLEIDVEPNPGGDFCENTTYSEKLTVTNTGDDLAVDIVVTIDSNATVKDTSSIMVTSGGVNIPFQIVDLHDNDEPGCPRDLPAGFSVAVGDLEPNNSIDITWRNQFCGVNCDELIPPIIYHYSFDRVCPAFFVQTVDTTVFYDIPAVLKDSISFDLGRPIRTGEQNEFRYDLKSEILDDSTGIIEVEFILPCGYTWSNRSLILDGKSPLSTDIDDSNIERVVVTLQYQLPFSSEHVWGNFYLDFICISDCNLELEFQALALLATCPAFFLECWFDDLGTSLVDINGQFLAGQLDRQFFDLTTRYISSTPGFDCDLSDCEEFDLVNVCFDDIVDVESHVFEAYLDFDAEFRRANIGLKDSNDDRVPDNNSTAPLNEIRTDRFVTGDTTLTQAAGVVKNDHLPVESENVKFRVCFEQHLVDSGINGTDGNIIEVDEPVELLTRQNGIKDIDAFIRIVDRETGNEYESPLNNISTVQDRYFSLDIINTRPIQSLDKWRLLSYTYQLNLSNASQIPGSTIPPDFKLTEGDSVYFEARHKIVANIGILAWSLRQYTETAIYNGFLSVEERFSCGRPLQQFELIGFDILRGVSNLAALPCDVFGSNPGSSFNLILGRDNFFTNEVRPFVKIESWDLLLSENYRLITPPRISMGMNSFPATVNNAPITPTQSGDLYRFDVLQFQDPPLDEGIYINFDLQYEALPATCSISDRSEISLTTRTNYVHDFCRFEPIEIDTISTRAFNPIIANLDLSAVEQDVIADDQTATWDLILENLEAEGQNVWIFVESSSNKIFDFVLRNSNTNQEIIANNGIFQLGDFDREQISNYELSANFSFCGIDSLNISYGWNCDPLQSINEFVCNKKAYTLRVEAPETGLPQLEMIIESPTDSVELCDTIPYHTIEIFNADFGVAYDMDFSILMPAGMTIIPGTSQISYSTASNNFVTIPDPTDLGNGNYIWKVNDIQSFINDNGLPGISDEPQNSFSIRFLSFANCRLIASSSPIVSISGLNFCDEPSNKLSKPGRPINIKGIEADYRSIITLNQDPEVNCGGELELSVNIEVSGTTTLGDSVLVTLPEGATYVNNSYQAISNAPNTEPLIFQRGNFTTLSWPMNSGISIGEEIQFNFSSIGYSNDACQDEIVQIQTIQNKEAFCKTLNDNCDVFIQTGNNFINVEINFPDWNLTSFNAAIGTNGIDYEISGNNSGNDAQNSFTIEYYLDTDGNGSVSAGDQLIGNQMIDGSMIQNNMFTLSGNLNVSENDICNVIAIISSDNDCICTESQINLMSRSLSTQDFQVCTGEAIEIGIPSVAGADYFWDNPIHLSCTDCPNPSFLANNTTDTTQIFNYVLTEEGGNCPRQVLIEVAVFPLPKILTDNQTICEGESIELMIASAQTVIWTGAGITDPNELNPTVTPSQSTTYIASFTSGNCMNIDSIRVEVIPGPMVDAGPDTSYCDATSGIEISTIFNSNYTYFWEPSSFVSDPRIHNPTITNPITSDFIVTVNDETTGCSLRDTIRIEFGTSPNLSTSPDLTICGGESVDLFVNGADTYSWSNSSSLNCSDCADVTASPTTTTTYVITGTTASICESVDSITVFVNGQLQFSDTTATICQGDTLTWKGIDFTETINFDTVYTSLQDGCDSTVTLNLTVTPPITEEEFILCEGDTVMLHDTLITSSAMICSEPMTTASGCDSTHCFNVIVAPKPNVIFEEVILDPIQAGSGDSTVLQITAVPGNVSYRWEPSDGVACDTCRVTMAAPAETTVYTGYVISEDGCEVEAISVRVNVFNECNYENITMPNIFSPNSDDRNDLFLPIDLGFEEIISFRVFNRWGQKIYDESGPNAQWDGNYKGEPQPVGVYIYMIDIGCDGAFQKTLTGDITLMK